MQFIVLVTIGFLALSPRAQMVIDESGLFTRVYPPYQVETKGCPAGGVAIAPTPEITDFDFVELERSGCFGSCPAYVVQIRADGLVSWIGTSFVDSKGRKSRQVSPLDARRLIAKFQTREFWSFCALYTHDWSDGETASVRVRIGNEYKSVEDYDGTGPIALRKLEAEIDDLANTRRWIGDGPKRPGP